MLLWGAEGAERCAPHVRRDAPKARHRVPLAYLSLILVEISFKYRYALYVDIVETARYFRLSIPYTPASTTSQFVLLLEHAYV